jgi:hypothetical protein
VKSEETIARAHCANYSLGKCLGVMLATNPKEGFSTSVKQWINTEQEGKDCGKIVSQCCYFQHIVVPGIQNNL